MATRRGASNAIWMRSGWLRGSIYWVLLVLGSALLFQNHYPRFTGAPYWPLQDTAPTPSFGGFGPREKRRRIFLVVRIGGRD